VKKLAARHPDITKLRVAVDTPHRRQSKGRRFRVQIDIGVPGSELVTHNRVDSNSERLIPALYDAFHRSERQLDEYRASLRHKGRRKGRKADLVAPVAEATVE